MTALEGIVAEPTGGASRPISSNRLTVAVLSDLHCFSESDPKRKEMKWPTPSFFSADAKPVTLRGDPIVDLERLITGTPALHADLLLCPGDLGDRASSTGIAHSWTWLGKIGTALGVTRIASTVGNHDLDHEHYEPDGQLKSLSPLFPINDAAQRAVYWTDHFAVIEDPLYRLLLLNSSAFHAKDPPEKNHGRIGERTLLQLQSLLATSERKPIQLLLCHHHPHQHADYGLGEHDVMTYGQHLLDCLGKHGLWLVVHGHKHHPKLTHAAGGSNAPWVFAAGSVSAIPWSGTSGHNSNQFYLIDFDLASFDKLGWGGRIRAWDWAVEDGWRPASSGSGLPSDFGFGFLGDIAGIAQKIRSVLPAKDAGYLSWSTLRSRIPVLDRMSPRDLDELTNHGIALELDANGNPSQIAREA